MKLLIITFLLFPLLVLASPESTFLRFVNKERERQNLAPLVVSDKLTASAQDKAQDMIDERAFTHFGTIPYMEYPILHGYRYGLFGENLSCGYDTLRQAFRALMDSPSHRKNILEPRFTDIGIAVTVGNVNTGRCTDDTDIIIVEHFGVLI